MSELYQNGTHCLIRNGDIFINGEKIDKPFGMITGNQTIVNGKIFIGGFQYFPKQKKFKRTLKAIFYYFF